MEPTLNKPLSPREEHFCQVFGTSLEFFGNGVQSYIEAYEPDKTKPNWYQNARQSASELLTKAHILDRINEIFEGGAFNTANIDKQLEIVIMQNADFGSKVAAIREFNKLKRRITESLDVTSGGLPIYNGKSTTGI